MQVTSAKRFVWPHLAFTIEKGESEVATIPEEARAHVALLCSKGIITLRDEGAPAPAADPSSPDGIERAHDLTSDVTGALRLSGQAPGLATTDSTRKQGRRR
jgi:hypothetical protein